MLHAFLDRCARNGRRAALGLMFIITFSPFRVGVCGQSALDENAL